MFKKVLESLSRSFSGKSSASAKQRPQPAAKPAPQPSAPVPPASGAKPGSLLDKVGGAAKPQPPAVRPNASPEDLCGITAKMSKEQVRDQLKLLYRRYNRGASSLDAKVRSEADRMLDAIVTIREKHFGEI